MDRRLVWIITGALVICNLRICADASASHTTSTKTLSGNYFVFCFPANLHDTSSPPLDRSMNIQLQSASPQLTQVSVSATDISWFEELTLNPGEAISLEAPEDAESSHSDTTSHQNGTIVIVSDHDIFVTAVSFVERSLATFAVPPFGSISGKEFVIAQYLPSPIYPSEIMITSGDSEARVVMHPTDTTDNKLLLDNIPYDEISSDEYVVVLPNHTSIQIRYGHDFTGWKFTASSPISIISAVECLFVTNFDRNCDHVAAYMPPVDQLGKEFTLAPFVGRTSGYFYRVVAARDQTVVSDSNVGDVLLDATDFHEHDEDESSVVTTISSNKPVLVVQFAKGYTSDSKDGDPTMIEVPPQEQYVNAISFASLDMSRYSINKNYLNLVIACDLLDGIIFNGEIFDSNDWLDVLTEGSRCAARREIGTTGVHSLSHESQSARFAAFVYGAGTQGPIP